MAQTIPVHKDGVHAYDIAITDSFLQLPEKLASLGYERTQKICIVTDSNVAPLYEKEVKELISGAFETVISHVFPAGEANKNLETVEHLYEDLILHHFDRRDILVALGGGVVGDLTGFTAATYLRGIDFIQVPTTLLSQVDSSVGGKTGVDFMQYKNMVGAFYQPKLVYMNLAVLQTLPKEQLISGMGEVIKHGLIKDVSYYDWMMTHVDEILALDPAAMEKTVSISCQIKRNVVELDPTEKGDRALLNFGHTIGHAIEKLSNFTLYHGECVAIGMIAAAYLSATHGYLPESDFKGIEDGLGKFGFKTRAHGFSAEEVLAATKSDKKMVGSKVKFILLDRIGNAFIYRDFTDEQLLDAIHYVCE